MAELALEPGRVVELSGAAGLGLTRIGLSLLATHAPLGLVAAVDTRGWLSPLAAWESGIAPEQLVVVRCAVAGQWPQVVSVMVEGMLAVYAEVPNGVPPPMLRRLAALARNRQRALLLRPLRGSLPAGISHLRLVAQAVSWEGADAGHGRLGLRRLVLEASGRGMGGITKQLEVEDDGTGALRVVSGLAIAPSGRAAV